MISRARGRAPFVGVPRGSVHAVAGVPKHSARYVSAHTTSLRRSVTARPTLGPNAAALETVARRTAAVLVSGALGLACDEPTLPAHCEAVPGYELPADCTAIIERMNDHSALYWTLGGVAVLGVLLALGLVRRHNRRITAQQAAEERVRNRQAMEIRLGQAMQSGQYAEALRLATDMQSICFIGNDGNALTHEDAETLERLTRVVVTLHLLQEPPGHATAAHVLFEVLPRLQEQIPPPQLDMLKLALVLLRAKFASVDANEMRTAWECVRRAHPRITPRSFTERLGKLPELNAVGQRRPWQFATTLLQQLIADGRAAPAASPPQADAGAASEAAEAAVDAVEAVPELE